MRRLNRRLGVTAVIMALLGVGGVGCASDGAEGQGPDRPKLVVGIQEAATPELVAASRVFDDAPFDLEWAVLSGPSQQLPAVYSGAVDIGYIGDTGLLFEAANSGWTPDQPKLQNFASWEYTYQAPEAQILTAVRTDSGISGPADLAGRKWVYNFGGTPYSQYIASLAKAELTVGDIEPIQLADAQTAAAAFARGDADVISGSRQLLRDSLNSGDARVLWTSEDTEIPNLAALVAKPSFLGDESKKPIVEDFLQRYGEYFVWNQDNPVEAQQILQRVFKFDSTRAKQYWESGRWNYVDIDDALIATEQELADRFLVAGTLPEEVDVNSIWNRAYQGVITKARGTYGP